MAEAVPVAEDGGDPTLERVNKLSRVRNFPVLGKYILCARLGSGGAGSVFMGYHAKLHRPVAVKVLNPSLVGKSAVAVARFEREAILSSNLVSDHIVPVTDAATVPGTDIHYLVMDLIRGENAEERVARRGLLDVPESISIVAQACRGLVDAHAADILHRDLKPANIMISATGRVRLADLGIATSLDRPNLKVTQVDEYLGTPQYMSPEQIHGMPLDGRSDVYSLGLTLYFLLTGVHPFHGSTPFEIMHRVTTEDLPDVRAIAQNVPPVLAKMLQAATARNPDARIPSAEALSGRLQAVLQVVGQVDLADPKAGGDKASLYVDLTEDDLRSISKEIDRLSTSAGQYRRSRSVILVAVALVAAAGAAVPLLMSKPPIDRRIAVAIGDNDAPRIAELLPEAMTSSQLSDSARAGLVESTNAWLRTQGNPTEIVASASEPLKAVLSKLASEDNPSYVQWIVDDARIAASSGKWEALSRLLGVLETGGTPKLFAALGSAVAEQVIESFRRSPKPTLGTSECDILKRLVARGADAPTLKKLYSLALLLSKPSPMPMVEVRQALRDAQDLKVVNAVAPRLKVELSASMATGVSAEAVKFIGDFALDAPELAGELIDLADAQVNACVERLDWEGVLLLLQPITPDAVEGAERRKRIGVAAVNKMAQNVERDALGTTRLKGKRPGPLLEALAAAGVRGAARWLVELRVEWTNTNKSGDKFGFADGVSTQEQQSLPGVVEKAIQESTASERGRMLFIKSELATLAIVDGDEQRNARAIKILGALLDGVSLRDPDCAARILYWTRALEGKNGVSLTTVAAKANELGLSMPVPDWARLKACLDGALSEKAPSVHSRARALTWHGYGTIVLAPDRKPCDRSFHRKVALELLEALRLGNWEAGMVLTDIDQYLAGQCTSPTPEFLSANEREEVKAVYSP